MNRERPLETTAQIQPIQSASLCSIRSITHETPSCDTKCPAGHCEAQERNARVNWEKPSLSRATRVNFWLEWLKEQMVTLYIKEA